VRKGGFEFWRRMSLPGIGSEINTSTSVRPRLHVFAPSWFQNWFQATRFQRAVCGMKRVALKPIAARLEPSHVDRFTLNAVSGGSSDFSPLASDHEAAFGYERRLGGHRPVPRLVHCKFPDQLIKSLLLR